MRFLISAGPTREHLDPVRFLSNRSTGKMGFALAEAAALLGHEVVLVAGPVSLSTPQGVRRVDVVSALDMLSAIESELESADVVIMAAAVADWRPKAACDVKLKKSMMSPTLELEPNPDILKTIAPRKGERLFVGFAAETNDVEAEAQRKLDAKNLDFICANDVSSPDAGFAVDTNRITIYGRGGFREEIALTTKRAAAERIIALAAEKRGGLND